MRRLTAGLLLCALMSLAACADISMKPERRAQMHNVAVISAVGNTLTQMRYTFILHLPERLNERLDWGFDEIIETTARASLTAQASPLTITPLTYNSDELAEQLYNTSDSEPYVDPARIAEALHAAIGDRPVDTIILITGGGGLDRKCNFGVAVANSTAPLIPTYVGVCLTAFILDAKTLGLLSQKGENVGDNYNRGGIFGPIDPAPFTTSFKLPLNEEQRKFLRPKYERMLREATASVMEKSGF